MIVDPHARTSENPLVRSIAKGVDLIMEERREFARRMHEVGELVRYSQQRGYTDLREFFESEDYQEYIRDRRT